MEITKTNRDLIESFLSFLINDECVIDWTTQYHLNIEDYIDAFENLDGSM